MYNLFNPIQAATDYKAGLISKRGLLIRKVVLIASLSLFATSFFFPSPYPIYDMISTIVYLSLYIGVPFYFNRGIDGKDFISRFAVVHTPIFIDVMILLIITSFAVGFFAAMAGLAFVGDPILKALYFSLDLGAGVLSVVLAILAFKKFR